MDVTGPNPKNSLAQIQRLGRVDLLPLNAFPVFPTWEAISGNHELPAAQGSGGKQIIKKPSRQEKSYACSFPPTDDLAMYRG